MEKKLFFGSKFDKLNFKQFALKLTDLVDNLETLRKDNGFVFAIDSGWGTGKTTFLKMWKSLIDAEESRIKAYYYNAWENDDFKNALLPLVYSLYEDGMIDNKNNSSLFFTNSILALRNIISNTSFTIGPVSLSGNAVTQTIDDIKEGLRKNNDGTENIIFDSYKEYMKSKHGFIASLESLPTLKNDIALIMVDELDRCRPSFAIETLEVVKHFFNIKNIVFVFCVDINQLSHSIATMYGQDMDAIGYLRRFLMLLLDFLLRIREIWL